MALGVEYGTFIPGVSRVIEIAKFDCSGLWDSEEIFGGGTAIYALIREILDCLWM